MKFLKKVIATPKEHFVTAAKTHVDCSVRSLSGEEQILRRQMLAFIEEDIKVHLLASESTDPEFRAAVSLFLENINNFILLDENLGFGIFNLDDSPKQGSELQQLYREGLPADVRDKIRQIANSLGYESRVDEYRVMFSRFGEDNDAVPEYHVDQVYSKTPPYKHFAITFGDSTDCGTVFVKFPPQIDFDKLRAHFPPKFCDEIENYFSNKDIVHRFTRAFDLDIETFTYQIKSGQLTVGLQEIFHKSPLDSGDRVHFAEPEYALQR
jgi:hypothetical protein